MGGNYVGGNHGHFEIKLQQLQVDIGGNQVWTEYDAQGNPLPMLPVGQQTSGVPVVVDFYGAGATTDMNGTALTSANQAAANQSVSQTVSLPLNITSANLSRA